MSGKFMQEHRDGPVVMVTLLVRVEPLAKRTALGIGLLPLGLLIQRLGLDQGLKFLSETIPEFATRLIAMRHAGIAYAIAHQEQRKRLREQRVHEALLGVVRAFVKNEKRLPGRLTMVGYALESGGIAGQADSDRAVARRI
jgi:hypothetical protein